MDSQRASPRKALRPKLAVAIAGDAEQAADNLPGFGDGAAAGGVVQPERHGAGSRDGFAVAGQRLSLSRVDVLSNGTPGRRAKDG
jgi:hypothetical protein